MAPKTQAQILSRLAQAMTERLGPLVGAKESVLIWAPPEFVPIALAERTMAALYGADGYEVLDIVAPEEVPRLLDRFPGKVRLLIRCRPTSPELTPVLRAELRAFLDASDQVQKLLVAVETDHDPSFDAECPLDLKLGPQAVALSDAECSRLGLGDDYAGRCELLLATGGAADLVALTASLGSEALAQPVSRWCDRIYPDYAADPRLRAIAVAGNVEVESLAMLLSAALDDPISTAEVAEVQEHSTFTETYSTPAIPEALRHCLVERLYAQEGTEVRAMRRRMLDVAAHLTPSEYLRFLAYGREYEATNDMLGASLPMLAAANAAQRRMMAALFPDPVPATWKALAQARKFLSGAWERADGVSRMPVTYQELHFLLQGLDAHHGSEFFRTLNDLFTAAADLPRPATAEQARREVLDVHAYLMATSFAFAAGDDDAIERPEEVAVLGIALVGSADACVVLGLIAEAHEAINTVLTITEMLPLREVPLHGLGGMALSRACSLAAEIGMPAVADDRRAQFFRSAGLGNEADPNNQAILGVAESFKTGWPGGVVTRGVQDLDLREPWAVLRAEAEALRALLCHGVMSGREWIRNTLNRAQWLPKPDWEWWTLLGIDAWISVRLGHLEAAAAIVERGVLPEQYSHLVRAAIAMESGKHGEAWQLVDEALDSQTLSHRWRMLALGLKAGLLCDPSREKERCVLLASVTWDMLPGTLVLLPDACREAIADHVSSETLMMPGLQGDRPRNNRRQTSRLTPRQMDVLRGLAVGETMPEIGARHGISGETVRTTAKALYRRLGVGGRDEAVEAARSLHLI